MSRVLIVQYAGDYREAVQRFAQGGEETFYAQKYSVNTVAQLAEQTDQIATLCCMTKESYDQVLDNGVRAIGAGFQDSIDDQKLIELVEKFKPTHLVLRTPIKALLRWGIKHKVKILALFADSFPNKKITSKIGNSFLARQLNHPCVEWVSNCNLPASISLQKIGVNPQKIIPYAEWSGQESAIPHNTEPKFLPQDRDIWHLFYAGQIQPSKGIDDVLKAIQLLQSQNFSLRLKVAGKGDFETYRQKCNQLGISDSVDFLGIIANSQVLDCMRKADCVIVPSRPEYPEGFPNTVIEALCSRTPLIASNHPVFNNILKNEQNALIFLAANAEALANQIKHLLTDADLYHHLSVNSAHTWEQLQLPVKWSDMLEYWLVDSPDNRAWLYQHSLASNCYDWFTR